ncbi:MAG: peptidylprolyl isomerase [Clostridia bacterium]|nr:peptidylprolyl isomerase [Clostridia bacterium]
MKRIIAFLLLTVMALTCFSACKDDTIETTTTTIEDNKTYYAVIEIVDYGTITVELDQTQAPVTVKNFVKLAESGFYDGLTFHRIMEGFMMQGGDPKGDGTGGSTDKIIGEFTSNGHKNTISHKRGVISMARSKAMNSASSQFFIVHEDSAFLDGDYAAFGCVVEGMDVVDKVCTSAKPIDGNGSIAKSAQPVIKSITIRVEDKKPGIDLGTNTETSSTVSNDSSDVSDESEVSKEDISTSLDKTKIYYATIDIKDYGTVKIKLDQDEAPITVENFVLLAESGFYDGLTFHRIMEGFMMQGGDPKGDGTGGSDKSIVGEFSGNGYDNDISHLRGVISMARAQHPDSASSQFFIVHKDSTFLDGLYAAFGYVTDGMDVVDAICEAAEPTDGNGSIAKDKQPIINSITIETVEIEE